MAAVHSAKDAAISDLTAYADSLHAQLEQFVDLAAELAIETIRLRRLLDHAYRNPYQRRHEPARRQS